MPYLPIKMPKLLALAASAAFSLILFTGLSEAAPVPAVGGLAASALPVEQAGYYRRHYRSYRSYDYPAGYGPRAYYDGGRDEIRELQRAYPSTNWPPSMRYVH
jgi:hypothetical protein